MSKSMIIKAIVAIAIIVGGILVIMDDDPNVPSGNINSISPVPTQE